MYNSKHIGFAAVAAAGTLALSGCLSSSDDFGNFSLSVTDAPVDDATAVVVEFTGVSIKPADGQAEVFTFDEPRTINLLDLQGTASEALLEDELVPAGEYEWIRLHVNALNGQMDSYIEFDDGGQHSLFIPSGAETGLKLVSGFVVPANGSADFTIDFDLRKSIANPQSPTVDYILKPALRLVDNAEVGHISGTVAAEWAADADCAAAVYVYEGHNAETGSVGSDNEPVTSALVALNGESGEYEYTAGFLLEGDYTAAFTCEADQDEPEEDNEIDFLQSLNTSVSVDETTELNFGPDA
ncbi:DUF4382 domain-containing protein [Natronospira bacteriovora]|uniref:DUF4382 domain-containing protein n=1 Tax=Natronospira bacteriovora TaxID=3069753 RepID=A0ABU0W6E0_9GAMM|nr:DUF4382 domain-containing protein [Natronospira sp. AB-CW4]MDQ2068565.1 DUF4382 domain-containing protein [Natronospira sp. AB-CW4]